MSIASLGLLATLAVHPELVTDDPGGMKTVAGTYDGFDGKAAEQFRQDQCITAEALRKGGQNMFDLAESSINLPAAQLHPMADRGYPDSPMAKAFQKDENARDALSKNVDTVKQSWASAVATLESYPGAPTGREKIFENTGLMPWLWQSYTGGVTFFFNDTTPLADKTSTTAVIKLGDQFYANTSGPEADAWKDWKSKATEVPPRSYADDSRIFLSSGGFPKTEPDPGSPEFRILVEDLKERFASCTWRNPVDPDQVWGKAVAAASDEWQKEFADQSPERAGILAANDKAGNALQAGTFALGKILGQSYIADYSTRWLDYYTKRKPAPSASDVNKAKANIPGAQKEAKAQLAALRAQLTITQQAAKDSDTSLNQAYAKADKMGAPRGRGLVVGQQKAQVTKGAAAALAAMVKAGETAEAATRAAASDADTINQRAIAQAAQVKTEFRRQAAAEAEWQAKAAADAAKIHRDNAKQDADTAKTKLGETLKAEANAKAAAQTAHDRRVDAEAQEKTAKAEKANAAAHQADANQYKQAARDQADKAKTAKDKAEASEQTASDKRDGAKKAADHARSMRDDAWDAEQKANADRAKADSKNAYADSLDAGADADAARQAANDADKHADDSEAAAKKAQTDADAATQAAEDADAAATRAEAAAKRARADSDAAQAAKAKADADVRTATASTADAIAASQHAASESRAAVRLADQAETDANNAKTQADAAKKDLAVALLAAAKAAGYAHITAQAAVDAGKSAKQVVKPANDAIELGSPYVDTDSVASLVVLTGQASKSLAEQLKAVADAHSKNAKQEAADAKALADKAGADTKAALQSAANAAQSASDARDYANQALDYSAAAAKSAAAAVDSLNRTKEYDRQAGEDAAAADAAAGRAEGYAKDARNSADQAALDAQAAHQAADQASQDAKDARAAADRADKDATDAEQYAKDADKYAQEAQEAADNAAKEQANQELSKGSTTGIPGVFAVPDQSTVEIVSSQQIGQCPSNAVLVGCDATYNLVVDYEADFYLCTDDNAQATADGCPKPSWQYLQRSTLKNVKIDNWQHHFSGEDIARAGWETLFGEKAGSLLFSFFAEDMLKCFHGSASGCAWAYATYFPVGGALSDISKAVKALDAAARTGIGFEDAFKALRGLDGLSPLTKEGIGARLLKQLYETCTKRAMAPLLRSGGGACENIIPYGSSELAHVAYEFRVSSGLRYKFGRNVAVARVPGWAKATGAKNDFVVFANIPQGLHSEELIIKKLEEKGFNKNQISELYSERSPCNAKCSPLVEGIPVTYSTPDGPGAGGMIKHMLDTFEGGRLARSTQPSLSE
ncbi:nucleic acid/nucleotide deaminase domain-containing protein [Streptomyces sp. NPDC007205]|uniref:nucleic acid/nucleotide deaminase domain-containing protein n=1 Tax=Streptomyces sp. NPDC007205 TaxID=3154316 RepID=UPI0033CB6645